MPFGSWVQASAQLEKWDIGLSLAARPETLRYYYSLSVGSAFLIAGGLIVLSILWTRLSSRMRDTVFSLTFTLAITCALMIYLFRMEWEGPWMPLHVIMKNPSSLPVFGHRLLFIWVARGFQHIIPGLSDRRAFYLSQGVATVLAVYALGRWSALHTGKSFAWAGQILGAIMISTCYTYFNFYDIGTVFFTTCGLIAIFTRKHWWLVPIVLVGTLNYEGLLLVIAVAAFVAYREEPPKKWVFPIAASFAAYCLVRFELQAAMPLPRQVDWRIWSNMVKPFLFHHEMSSTLLALVGWYLIGWMSLSYCDPRLKRLILLFPLVFLVTILFGQLHEPRQFDAFIPIVVAAIVSASTRRLYAERSLAV